MVATKATAMPLPTSLMSCEMLHDLDEAEDRADDADGGGEAAGCFEDLGDALILLALVVELQLHHLAQVGGADAVDGQHQALLEKGVVDLGEFGIEGEDAFFAGLVGIAQKVLHEGVGLGLGVEEDVRELAQGLKHDAQGELHHDRADGAADDDQRSGGLEDLRQTAAIEHEADADAGERKGYAAKGALIQTYLHQFRPLMRR